MENPESETEISIINTIETMVTLLRIAEVYGIAWNYQRYFCGAWQNGVVPF